MAITLGVDCGTQSTKTIALDAETGEILASASQPYDLLPGLPPGHAEQHPQTWADALLATVDAVVAQLGPRRADVRGIGVSGQQHGFVPLDAAGEVIRPTKLWCDVSTVEECALLTATLGGPTAVIALLGNAILPGFTAPKILWLKRHEPENFARLAHTLLPHDYLNFVLTGAPRMEYGDASGTALLDVKTRAWSEAVADAIDPRVLGTLPPLGSSREAAGPLRPDLAARWGLPGSVVVSAGGGDNMMGAIGTGNVRPGAMTASLGTSGTLYAYAAAPVVDPDGEIAAFCDSTDAWLPLLCTMNVTVATEQVRRLFGWSHEQFEHAAAGVAPGADGLLFLPYLQGERTPNYPAATGVLHGLTPANTTPAHLARATLEGVTLGLAYGLEKFRRLGAAPAEIRLIGGGSRSALWRQLCADIFGAPVVTLVQSEGAALGAALQALALVENVAPATLCDRLVTLNEAERTHPRPELTAFYADQLRSHTALGRKLFGENLKS